MSRLFIELYFDEDVDVLLVDLLASRGFSATTTQGAGQTGKPDASQLSYSTAQNLTIVTHNRADFEALARTYFDEGRSHPGIIIAVRRLPHQLARRLLVILNSVSAEEMVDQIIYI